MCYNNLTSIMNKISTIISILFVISVIIIPLAMPNCGMNGFHMGFVSTNNHCRNHIDWTHISFMRGFIFVTYFISFITLAFILFKQSLFSLIGIIRYKLNIILKQFNIYY